MATLNVKENVSKRIVKSNHPVDYVNVSVK